MRQGLDPAAGFIMLPVTAKSRIGMELTIKEPDSSFNLATPFYQEGFFLRRILDIPIGARRRSYRDAFPGQPLAFFFLGPIRIVPQEMASEGRFQQSIKALDIVAIAADLQNKRDAAVGSEHEVLSNAVELSIERGAIPMVRQPAQAFFFGRSYRTAHVNRMGVDDEKGGGSSLSSEIKAWQSDCINGVKRARRSAQFWRVRRRGKSFRIKTFASSQE